MKMDDYQRAAFKTFVSDPSSREVDTAHLAFGLLAEAGEVATLYQKMYRGDPEYLDYDSTYALKPAKEELLKKELGDVLWHISAIARHYNWNLSDVAETNLAKLADRQKRMMLKGDGDNR